jgi:4-carboxymuconolactone decarboxylase
MAEQTTEAPVLDLLKSMTAESLAASSLDVETLALVRIAALAAVDAPPVSYLLNLEAASEVGIDPEQVRGVLAAIAPIVGTARVASATGKIVDALDVAIEVADLEAQSEESTCRREPSDCAPGAQPPHPSTGPWRTPAIG